MSAGKCNLLLIKTCCWHWLQTDSDLRLSSSHFSSPLLSFYFSSLAPPTLAPSSLSCYLNTQLFPLTLYVLPRFLSSPRSGSDILCFLLSSIFSPPLSFLPLTLQSHHHEEEKRALSREIIVLNNHLMEAKITINKLREDNVSTRGCII